MVMWIGRFEIASCRVITAWMDLLDLNQVPQVDDPAFADGITQQQAAELQGIDDMDERRTKPDEIREEMVGVVRNAHRQLFPLNDNLMSLIFLVQADLNEAQRERFVSSMSLRQIEMPGYIYLAVKQLFLELFCVTRTSIADPQIRQGRKSAFLVQEEGLLEGEEGFWVTEEETGEEGFVSLFAEDEFCVLQAKGGYMRRRIQGRRFRRGKGF